MIYLRRASNLWEDKFGPAKRVIARESELSPRQNLGGGDSWESGVKILYIARPCPHCGASEMSAIPMGAFAAHKLRGNHNGGGGNSGSGSENSGSGKIPGQSSFQQTPAASNELPYNPPAQYNGKLMNSIWGMYNRYSVHNIKSHIAFDKV